MLNFIFEHIFININFYIILYFHLFLLLAYLKSRKLI